MILVCRQEKWHVKADLKNNMRPTIFQVEGLMSNFLSFALLSHPSPSQALSSLSKPLCLFCFLSFFTLGGKQNLTNTHSIPLALLLCIAFFHCEVQPYFLYCMWTFPVYLRTDAAQWTSSSSLPSFCFCIIPLQISISMNWCGVRSQSSGCWCFSTVGKLPPLLKKIETHAPDETAPDKSQHETHQASLSGLSNKAGTKKTILLQSALYQDLWGCLLGPPINVTMQHSSVSAATALDMAGVNILPWLGKIFDDI